MLYLYNDNERYVRFMKLKKLFIIAIVFFGFVLGLTVVNAEANENIEGSLQMKLEIYRNSESIKVDKDAITVALRIYESNLFIDGKQGFGLDIYCKKSNESNYELLKTSPKYTSTLYKYYEYYDFELGEEYDLKVVPRLLIYDKAYESASITTNFTMPEELTGELNLKSTLTDFTKVKLNWNKIEGADGYIIRYKTKDSSAYFKDITVTTNEFEHDTYSSDSEYIYSVLPYKNYNIDGTTQKYIDYTIGGSATQKTITRPEVKTSVVSNSNGNVSLSFDLIKGSADGYNIYYQNVGYSDFILAGTTTNKNYTIKNLLPNSKYSIIVRPFVKIDDNTKLEGNYYNAVTVTTGKINISKLAKVTGIYNKLYTGKARTLNIKVTYNGKKIPVKVTYKNNKNIGLAYVIITATGDYTGTITKKFYIIPSTPSITSLKSTTKKKATIKYSYIKGGVRYQIAYKVNGTNTWEYAYYGNSYTKTIKNLKSKKKYTFKVRAYKKVNGKYIYGSWSNTKTITIK